ncbi:MAG: MarR family transcriptional regulator [Bacteroidota bacterium]
MTRKVKIYGFEMARISEVYLSTLSRLMKPYGMERYFKLFILLCENSGKITQKELGATLKRDKVSTMRSVDYLSENGFVIRKQDPNDKRCQILEVTDKALQLLPIVKEAIQQTNELLLADFTPGEKMYFEQSMDKLFKTIGTLPEPEFIVKAFKRKIT